MANKKFGDTLRELRNAKGYTQQQAADLLGLKNKSTLGSWEVGKSEPDGYTLLKLCKLYEIQDIYAAFQDISVVPKQAKKNKVVSDIYANVKDLPEEDQIYILEMIKLYKKHKIKNLKQ